MEFLIEGILYITKALGKIQQNNRFVTWKVFLKSHHPVNIKKDPGVPVVAQWLVTPTRNHEVEGLIPGRELWCRLQTWLGSRIAVALE